ncbi:MAG: hypothetical protein CXZ00_07850 [Acidobacteria bacterium]|nr:MAG: hypothetical protein CXZ00_07850 [Acidobacteriota bacterium]
MAQGIQVLVVDDNPVIRELLLNSLSPLATVEVFAGASEAFGRAERQTPDLVISDYRMPGLNGLELLAKLRVSFPRVAVMMLASHSDIKGPLAGSTPLVEDFIEKPFFLEEAIARVKRVLDRIGLSKATRNAADSSSLRGTLAQMSVVDLMQTLDMGRKSGRLVITHAARQCEMQFREGQLVHATLENLTGEEAVYKAVAWAEGTFTIDFEGGECPRTITSSTQSVLLEALRLFDEAQHEAETTERAPQQNCSPAFQPAFVPAV